MDSRDRAETLDQFLDHAALIADADDYDARSQITLMSLHAAKGLEFPLVFLSGLEEGLFPHSRTMLVPEEVEEERRLCYVGMTRAMDQLVLTRAVYRRRYGTDLPEASVPSRFLEEVPGPLIEELGSRRGGSSIRRSADGGRAYTGSSGHGNTHYSYEDEDQSKSWRGDDQTPTSPEVEVGSGGHGLQLDGQHCRILCQPWKEVHRCRNPLRLKNPAASADSSRGQRVRHPKYGEGTVYQREGEGEEAKITVQFPRFGLKKLVEKYAQLERA